MTVHLQCENVSVAYQGMKQLEFALRDIDVTIKRGTWTAIVGPNGSGKSTLGRVIAGLCPVSRGQVRVLPDSDGRTRVGVVFQDPNAQIIGQTVYEDVAFGFENLGTPESEIPSLIQHALSAVGLKVPLHTPVETLSGGQKMLLCAASTLAMRPSCIVCDESTAMLSPLVRETLLTLMKEMQRQGVTVIWITHFMEDLAYADGVIALQSGNKVYDGPVPTFFHRISHQQSPCEQLGFPRPFVVEVADELRRAGVDIPESVLSREAFAKAVAHL